MKISLFRSLSTKHIIFNVHYLVFTRHSIRLVQMISFPFFFALVDFEVQNTRYVMLTNNTSTLLKSILKCSSTTTDTTINHDTLEFGYAADHMVCPAWTDKSHCFISSMNVIPLSLCFTLNRAEFRISLKGGEIAVSAYQGGQTLHAVHYNIYIKKMKCSRGAQNPQGGGGGECPAAPKKNPAKAY